MLSRSGYQHQGNPFETLTEHCNHLVHNVGGRTKSTHSATESNDHRMTVNLTIAALRAEI